MVTDERIKELRYLFYAETNDTLTSEWRKDLTLDELMIVYSWDEEYDDGFRKLINALYKACNK